MDPDSKEPGGWDLACYARNMADSEWKKTPASPLDTESGPFLAGSALALGSNLFNFEIVSQKHLGVLKPVPKKPRAFVWLIREWS